MAGIFPFTTRLEAGLALAGIALDPAALGRLERYWLELRKWNKKINLIAKGSTDEEIVENHFLDSLTLLPLLGEGEIHLLDIGSGAGFPGLVVKAARPDIHLTLVEPRHKRVAFLGQIVRSLQLSEVRILACRVEESQFFAGLPALSHITSRAVSDIGGFLAMTEQFFVPGLQLICMKGPKWQEELAAAEPLLARLPLGPPQICRTILPFSGAERVLLSFPVVSRS